MERHPNDLTTDEEIDAALEAAKELDGEPRVVSAEYLGGGADLVVLRLSTGGRLAIPREQLQGLEKATEAQLAEIQLWGGGISVSWPQLDVDHYLPHLLARRYGDARWMEVLQRRGVAVQEHRAYAQASGS
jgi:hypothetical protein